MGGPKIAGSGNPVDFWQTLLVLMRRWYVAVPVLVLTVGVTGGVFFTVPTQYDSTGTAVLTLPPAGASVSSDPTKPEGTVNPLLAFDGSLEVTAKLEIATLGDPAVLDQIAAEGGTATIQAGDGSLNGPFIVIIGTSPSPEEAQRTVTIAMAHVQKELEDRQNRLGAPKVTYINVEKVVGPTVGVAKIGGKVRAAGVALALGLIVSFCSVFMLESFLQRRRGTGLADLDPVLLDRFDPRSRGSDGIVDPQPRLPSDAEATVRVPALARPVPSPVRRPAPMRRDGPVPTRVPAARVGDAPPAEPLGTNGDRPSPVARPSLGNGRPPNGSTHGRSS